MLWIEKKLFFVSLFNSSSHTFIHHTLNQQCVLLISTNKNGLINFNENFCNAWRSNVRIWSLWWAIKITIWSKINWPPRMHASIHDGSKWSWQTNDKSVVAIHSRLINVETVVMILLLPEVSLVIWQTIWLWLYMFYSKLQLIVIALVSKMIRLIL